MERWKVASRRWRQPRLLNHNQTTVWISPRARHFNLQRVLDALERVGFPLRYTRGLISINFAPLKGRLFGYYEDGEIWVDVRKKRRLRTIIETVVHEIAHHLDMNDDLSSGLSQERKLRARYIHRIARESNDEYFARGFERFYSMDPRDKKDLKRFNPHLYRRISKLHGQYKRKPRVSS